MELREKPKTLVCFICGREFGTRSLQIHLQNCEQRFLTNQGKKHPKDRIISKSRQQKVPQRPELLHNILQGHFDGIIDQYNEEALKIYKYQVLPACRYCGRTFNEESLKVHENGCNKKGNVNMKGRERQKVQEKEQGIKKPRTLVCCVCGRQFGLTSLRIHYPQCLTKFMTQQSKKQRTERRNPPTFHHDQLQLLNTKQNWSQEQIERFNSEAGESYKQKGMVHCSNCKRSFMPDPYKRHLKNCLLINGEKEVQKNYDVVQAKYKEQIKKPKVLMCHICGRQFGLTSLFIHQKSCAKKFTVAQKKKPRDSRKTLPHMPANIQQMFDFKMVEDWSTADIEKYNSIANQVYRSQSLTECTLCHRRFFEEAYEKHRKYCEKDHEKSQKKKVNLYILQDNKIQVEPDNFHLHNEVINQEREDLEDTTQINQKQKVILTLKEDLSEGQQQIPDQEIKKIEDIQQQSAKSGIRKRQQQQMQVKIKKDSENSNNLNKNQFQVTYKKQENLKQTRSEYFEAQNSKKQSNNVKKEVKNMKNIQEPALQMPQYQDQLLKCEKCNRKFYKERLEKHESVCKGNSKKTIDGTKIQVKNVLTFAQQQKKQKPSSEGEFMEISKILAPCSKCGRKFLQSRLQKHEECCKGTKKLETKTQVKVSQNMDFQMKKAPKMQKREEKDTFVGSQLQLQEFQPQQLKQCGKCRRKFRLDRILLHQNACKAQSLAKADNRKSNNKFGRLGAKAYQDKLEDKKQMDAVRKTKQNFFKMVQDLKDKKVGEEQIDMQLESQLDSIAEKKNFPSNRILRKRNGEAENLEIGKSSNMRQAIQKSRDNYSQNKKEKFQNGYLPYI